MSDGESEIFRVTGTIVEHETGRPLPDLVVRAFDRDLISDDRLGFTTTDEHGRFEIHFDREAFRDFAETHPDLYLRIYEPTGIREIHHTTHAVRWNASTHEQYQIRIPGRALRLGAS